MNIGVMQGRLLDFKKNNPQTFPFKDWEKEFELAENLKLKTIQWLFLNGNNQVNPILKDHTQKIIFDLNKKFNVKVKSVCAHEFLINPIIKKNGIDTNQFNKLCNLIYVSSKLNINYIVLPLIENSSIKNVKNKFFLEFLNNINIHLENHNVEIHIESDFNSNKIVKEFSKLNSNYLKICIDLGNIYLENKNLMKEISNCKNYLGSIHIKEKNNLGKSFPLGSVGIDYTNFFDYIFSNHYNGDIILETQNQKNEKPYDSIYYNLNYLKKYLKL